MAYAAVISLKNTIQRLLKLYGISFESSGPKILESAYEEVVSLQKVVERFDSCNSDSSERMKVLGGQIRDEVYRFEDAIDSCHHSKRVFSQSESRELEELRQALKRFTQTVEKIKEMYVEESDNLLAEEDNEEEEEAEEAADFGGTEMVGSSVQFQALRKKIINRKKPLTAMTLIGMAGIGKTTLAKKIFEDELVTSAYDCRAFVKVGQKPRMRKALLAVLAQVNHINDEILMLDAEELDEYFLESLTDRKYLIVLDDVWDANFFGELRKRLPDKHAVGLVFVTTRLRSVAESVPGFNTYCVTLLNEEESWDLLRKKVFAGGFCPPLLEKAGRKIAENCEGLPLLILKVADLLSESEKTLEYWNKVAADNENPIFTDACDQISEVLYPSYNYLPQHLKACFLYMGVFCRIYDIHCSKLFNLWIDEGILELHSCQSLEEFARNCLTELISCSVVLECKWSIKELFKVKTCRLHSVFWHLCKREAGSNKFLLILNTPADILVEGIVSQRRLSIYNNILLSIKKVYESILSIENAHSLLCTGPHHQYGVPICSGLRLLRVLDVLTIRLYEFPVEVVELVQLRYLSLTYDGKIPPSISKLWSIQCLIILQHIGIKHTLAQSYLPTEIWELQELKYLQVVGRNLPDPCGAALPNLTTLLDVGPYSCNESVLQSIPKLKKLRVRIELTPGDVEYSSSFDHIPHLGALQSFQCVVVNPQLGPDIVAPSLHLHVFATSLQKLTLSGVGYPWKDIQKISKLPFLIVLKLRCYAFRGEEWEVKDEEFYNLKVLLIEDSDLVKWTVWERAFPSIGTIIIKNCYKLQAIPSTLYRSFVELDDCSPLAVRRAKEDISCFANKSSWDDGLGG